MKSIFAISRGGKGGGGGGERTGRGDKHVLLPFPQRTGRCVNMCVWERRRRRRFGGEGRRRQSREMTQKYSTVWLYSRPLPWHQYPRRLLRFLALRFVTQISQKNKVEHFSRFWKEEESRMKERRTTRPLVRERERARNGMSDARNEIGPIKIRRRSRRKKRHAFFFSPPLSLRSCRSVSLTHPFYALTRACAVEH